DYWMLAQARQAHGDLKGAATDYEAALREEPFDGELLNNFAIVEHDLGDRKREEALLRRAVEVAPGLAYPHKNLGILLASRGDRQAALDQLRIASRLEPEDAEALAMTGALLVERGDRQEGVAALHEARSMPPQNARLLRLIDGYLHRAASVGAA